MSSMYECMMGMIVGREVSVGQVKRYVGTGSDRVGEGGIKLSKRQLATRDKAFHAVEYEYNNINHCSGQAVSQVPNAHPHRHTNHLHH